MSAVVKPFEPSPEVQEITSEFGLVMPAFEVEPQVVQRLARVERVLEFSEWDLLRGVVSYGIENPIQVKIQSLPKNEENLEPAVEYGPTSYMRDVKKSHQVSLKIDTNPNERKRTEKLLNVALWTGIVVAEELAEGRKSHFQSIRDKNYTWDKYIRPSIVNVVGATPNLANLAGLINVDVPASLALAGLAFSSTGYLLAKAVLPEDKPTVTDFIANYKKEEITALASEHPVLSYDVSFDEPAVSHIGNYA